MNESYKALVYVAAWVIAIGTIILFSGFLGVVSKVVYLCYMAGWNLI